MDRNICYMMIRERFHLIQESNWRGAKKTVPNTCYTTTGDRFHFTEDSNWRATKKIRRNGCYTTIGDRFHLMQGIKLLWVFRLSLLICFTHPGALNWIIADQGRNQPNPNQPISSQGCRSHLMMRNEKSDAVETDVLNPPQQCAIRRSKYTCTIVRIWWWWRTKMRNHELLVPFRRDFAIMKSLIKHYWHILAPFRDFAIMCL